MNLPSFIFLTCLMFNLTGNELSSTLPSKEYKALKSLTHKAAMRYLKAPQSTELLIILDNAIPLLSANDTQDLKELLSNPAKIKLLFKRNDEIPVLTKYLNGKNSVPNSYRQQINYLLCLMNALENQVDQNSLILQFHKNRLFPQRDFKDLKPSLIYNRSVIAERICLYLEKNYLRPLSPELTDKLFFIVEFLNPQSLKFKVLSTAYDFSLPISLSKVNSNSSFKDYLKTSIKELSQSHIYEEKLLSSLLSEILSSIERKPQNFQLPLKKEVDSFWEIMKTTQGHKEDSIKTIAISPKGKGIIVDIIARSSKIKNGGHIGFHSPQPPSTIKALNKAVEALKIEKKADMNIKFFFALKSLTFEGNSNSLALSCLLHSKLNNLSINPQVTLSGAIDRNKNVLAVGAIKEKVKTAFKSKCPILILPKKHKADLIDLCLTNGFDELYETQIFKVSTIDMALPLTLKKPPKNISKAIKVFSTIKELSTQKKIAKLEEVLTLAPNHLSAQIIKAHLNSEELQFSLKFSVEIIEKITKKVLYEENCSIEEINNAQQKLLKTNHLNADVSEYLKSVHKFMNAYKNIKTEQNSSESKQSFINARNILISATEKLNKQLQKP